MEPNSLTPELQAQAAKLKRGTLGIVPENGLEQKLLKAAKTGKPLKIKLGLDPTAPDIHLGFAVVLRKLRQFQDLGHEVIIIIGDYTALIGDPSGRSATRPMLSAEEIQANAKTYVDQLARILDREKTTVRFNGEWLGKLDFAEVVRLASNITVARVLERDDFAKRYAEHQPISLHELLYPLAQAYDSVAIEADIEMGGQDQMFNILTGRDLQEKVGQEPQIALFMPLLVGLDGVKKMSKSLGNYIGIAETPDAMFGKILSLSDAQMRDYFILCTDVPTEEIEALLKRAETGEMNPKDVKRRLAQAIIDIYHPPHTDADGATVSPALIADAEWHRVHAAGELPSDMPDITIPAGSTSTTGTVWICKLLVIAGMAKSNGEARRLVTQGGVELQGEKVTNPDAEFPLPS
ncbi:MAG TPA: tyrosine--tRNA ligase, partial [Chthonomonadaceae bacterium]|nr:tyrosine--tRNA ligase [Chthonomonadaceae bacterium]